MMSTKLSKVNFLIVTFLISSFLITGVLQASTINLPQEKQTKKEATTHQHKSSSKTETEIKSGDKAKLTCIVSGEEADPELTLEYKGKAYNFCCKKCVKKFKSNPEKYINNKN